MSSFIRKYCAVVPMVLAVAFMSFSTNVRAQAETATPCGRAGNPRLPELLKKGSIGALPWWGGVHMGGDICDWSSSHLGATGKPPVKPIPTANMDEDEAEYASWRALENWSCMYTALSAMDGDTSTAWCEGKKDEGVGEVLVVKVDTTKPVRIWSGLGASDHLYKANNRARKIRIWALQARQARKEIGQYETGLVFEDITVVGSHEVTLKDLNGWQPLPLPPRRGLAFRSVIENGKPAVDHKDSTFLAVEILSVYRGTKYNDTCISEIGIEQGK